MRRQPALSTEQAHEAVAMHKAGQKVEAICVVFNAPRPAIYYAFKRAGYCASGRGGKASRSDYLLPPDQRNDQRHRTHANANWRQNLDEEEAAIAARRIRPRDPCFRCGCRGDLGCGCDKAPIGWSVS